MVSKVKKRMQSIFACITDQLKIQVMKPISIFIVLLLTTISMSAQTVQLLTSGRKISMRGLSVPNDNTVWVCGNNGQIGQSLDGGITWKWSVIKGYENTEFRDIEAFDATTAVVMGIAEPAYILRTVDGGQNWTRVFSDSSKGMFLDAMEFWNSQSGIVIGDPIKGRFFIARTFDEGRNWQGIPENYRPLADSGEACFASSGTNIRALNKAEAIFISGGLSAHLFIRDKKIELPLGTRKESSGANSIAIKNKKTFMIAGGDFNEKDASSYNCIFTSDAGKNWQTPIEPPHGYRSCVVYLRKKQWIMCGLNGVDFTSDDGKHFKLISKDGYHVCAKSKKGKTVYFAGGGGRIGKLVR
jgi:photosystem II stability/assembly factor-like uncharacterized protein